MRRNNKHNRTTNNHISKYDSTMLKLAKMASINIARRKKISRTEAFMDFVCSKTGEMLFDEKEDMWMNGPDYIADEYIREKYYIRHGVPM